VNTTWGRTWPAKVVQENLGHSTITLALDTYRSIYSEVAAEAAVALVPRTLRYRATGLLGADPNPNRGQPKDRQHRLQGIPGQASPAN